MTKPLSYIIEKQFVSYAQLGGFASPSEPRMATNKTMWLPRVETILSWPRIEILRLQLHQKMVVSISKYNKNRGSTTS